MSSYRPEPRPHLARMWLILALCGALLLATAWLASEIDRPAPQNYQGPGTVSTYDPGLYTPFTQAPR